jgi:hypothetical protein
MMLKLKSKYLMTALTGLVLVSAVSVVNADQWNDRVELTFSSPVMVPGTTLQPGKYVFELANSTANRHLVRVRNANDQMQVALIQAIPMKRTEVTSDTALQFNPTDAAAPPALKGYFHPGSRYGHEFIYPDEQARHIAERTKTVVLSVDVPGTDLEAGMLRTYDAAGRASTWQADAETQRDWNTWRASAEADELKRATAPAVRGNFEGTRVALDDLESNPKKYMGQRISVDAEVEEIYGPRLFTIDEPHWGDLDGEILVLLPTPLAALVKDDDRVTITGKVQPFVRAEIEREWGWLGLDPGIEIRVGSKPVLVAERLIGGDNKTALVIDTTPETERAVGTSGVGASPASPQMIATGDERLVGRPTTLSNVPVARTAKGAGFFVTLGEHQVFVLPAQPKTMVADGERVTVTGVVMQMPRGMRSRLNAPANMNDDIYVYARSVQK